MLPVWALGELGRQQFQHNAGWCRASPKQAECKMGLGTRGFSLLEKFAEMQCTNSELFPAPGAPIL